MTKYFMLKNAGVGDFPFKLTNITGSDPSYHVKHCARFMEEDNLKILKEDILNFSFMFI